MLCVTDTRCSDNIIYFFYMFFSKMYSSFVFFVYATGIEAYLFKLYFEASLKLQSFFLFVFGFNLFINPSISRQYIKSNPVSTLQYFLKSLSRSLKKGIFVPVTKKFLLFRSEARNLALHFGRLKSLMKSLSSRCI